MSLKIYTYSDPYFIDREAFWEEIKRCAHFCVSQAMVKGLEATYPPLKYPATVRELLNAFYSDWESENKRVRQMMETDNAIRRLKLDGDESGTVRRSLEHNTGDIVKCVRIFSELGLDANSFELSEVTEDQKNLIEIYKLISEREKTSFRFDRITQREVIDERILTALKNAAQKSKREEQTYSDLDRNTVVFHGIHQFSPALLCAVKDIAAYKNVILLFNYQQQYKTVYQTWLNIYSMFEKDIVHGDVSEFRPNSLCKDSYPCNTLADGIGTLSDGRLDELKREGLADLEVTEFEHITEFAGYCALLYEKAKGKNRRKGGWTSVLYDMGEQLYSASGRVNDILRAYFPEQYGERHFLEHPMGQFFSAVVELWDNENEQTAVNDMALIKNCLVSGLIKEAAPGELIGTFNKVEPYIEKETTLTDIIHSLKRLGGYMEPTDPKLQRIGCLGVGAEKLGRLITALEELDKTIKGFFSDFNSGGDNFDRFYRRVREFIAERTRNNAALGEETAETVKQLLERLENIDLPDTGSFTCLKQTMSFYLSQDDSLYHGSDIIVRSFEQIDGDILRSGGRDRKVNKTRYHFCCLSDADICAAKDERLPWPLDVSFFESAYKPIEQTDQNYRIFLKAKSEFKNYKRYALLYGLEFNRVGCKLSYVKTVGRKENELYHLIQMLGVKVTKYRDENETEEYRKFEPTSVEPSGSFDLKKNEEINQIRYSMCPYKFALEGAVREKTVFGERFLITAYFEILLKNAVIENNPGLKKNDPKLRELIEKEYQALDGKFRFADEYERSQIISNVFNELSENRTAEPLKEDFLKVDLSELEKKPSSIDLAEKIGDGPKYFKEEPKKHCMYCSCKDVCLKKSKQYY